MEKERRLTQAQFSAILNIRNPNVEAIFLGFKLDRWDKLLIGAGFLVMLGAFCFGRFYRPLNTAEVSVLPVLAFGPVLAALLRHTLQNRSKNKSAALFYVKAGVLLYIAVWLVYQMIRGLVG